MNISKDKLGFSLTILVVVAIIAALAAIFSLDAILAVLMTAGIIFDVGMVIKVFGWKDGAVLAFECSQKRNYAWAYACVGIQALSMFALAYFNMMATFWVTAVGVVFIYAFVFYGAYLKKVAA